MATDGLLTEVLITERGSHAADVSVVGTTTVQVSDVTDFTDYTAEDSVDPDTATTTGIGVVVDILGERYTVSSVIPGASDDTVAEGAGEVYDLAAELTPGTLSLTEPLRAQVDEDDPVWLVVGTEVATDAYAVVSFTQTAEVLGEDTDSGDVAQVPISYGQRASFPEGVYSPPVPISVSDDLTQVLDVPGVKPTIDGSTIINLPDPEGSDGLPPAESPTPVVYSGLGSLQVRWTGIANADPVSYRVYLSTLDQYPPAGSSLVATTTSTQVFLATDADGNRLVYGQPYYVSIEAFDADGAADPSPLVAGSVMQVTNEDVAAEFVYAGQIIANQIVGGEITSPLVLSSSIKTGTEGARVEIDGSGIVVYDSTGTPVVLVPTEGTAIFRGDAEIGDLTLVGGATLRGSTEVSRSAYIVLANKVTPSAAAPSLSNTWDTHPTDLVVPAPTSGEYPASYVDLPWTLQGVTYDPIYARYVWWGYVTLDNGNQDGLYFSSVNADSPTVTTFQGVIWDDEMLALGYSGDSPSEANLPAQEPGYYYVTRYSDRYFLNWVPEAWDGNDDYTGEANPVYIEVTLPNVANFRWAVTNFSDGGFTYARIYGAVRNTDGTVTLNVWDPNTTAVSLVAITNPGAEADWDSKWGRAGTAAGVGALVEDGNYIRLATTAASGSAAYTIGEKIDIPVNPGERITAGNRVWPGNASLLGKAAQLQILWWNASDALISTVSQAFTFPASSAWVTATVEGTAPAGAVRMSMRMVFTATATGQTVYGGTTSIYKAGGLSSPTQSLTLNTGAAITELVGLTVAQGDFPADRVLLIERTGSTTTVRSFTTAGVRQAAEDFPLPTSGVASLYWNNDTQWWETVDDNGTVYKHEPGTKTYDKLHASFTWKRGTQYESAQSSVATINHKRRSKLVINIPPKVITGAADDPDSAGIYLGQGATVPARTGMYLQATVTGTALVVTDPVWSTANPPDPANNPKDFPSAIPGRFYSASADAAGPLVDLKGDGTWRLGALTGLASGAVNGAGRVQAGVSTYRATANSSAPGTILGQEATPTVWSSSILRGFTYASNGTWTCQPGAAGTYLVWAKATWAADTVNDWGCGLQVWKNGAQMGGINDITLHSKVLGNSTGPVLLATIEIAVGDQMALSIWQASGSSKTPNGVQFYLAPLLS